MNIEEMKRLKQTAEAQIAAALNEFEKNAGVRISELRMEREQMFGPGRGELYTRLEVRL